MSHDELDTLDVLDEGEFPEEGLTIVVDEPEKPVITRKVRSGIRRRIDDVLEEQRLKEVLKTYEDCFQQAE